MSSDSPVARLVDLATRIAAQLETRSIALAAFQGGSAAWGKSDERSDVNLKVLVAPGAHLEVLGVVESVLLAGPGIARRLPRSLRQPGVGQCFYEARGIPSPNLLDVTTFEGSRDFPPERHGQLHVFFNRGGALRQTPTTPARIALKLIARTELLHNAHRMFGPFVAKELARGRAADALRYYQDDVDRAVELTRIVHCPERHDFGVRYLSEDLPAFEARELERMLFVPDVKALARLHQEVSARIVRLYGELRALYVADSAPLAAAS
jgi:hypothetical protein